MAQHNMTQRNMMQAEGADWFADPLIQAYFSAREHESFYRSLHHANTRRDFHERFIRVLMDFVHVIRSTPSTHALDAMIARLTSSTVDKLVDKPEVTPATEAKRIHPVGCELLGIADILNLDVLKVLYRAAALRYHPDKGGTHAEMLAVNEAHALFHEMLCRRRVNRERALQIRPDHEFPTAFLGSALQVQGCLCDCEFPIRTAKDYLYVAGVILFEINLDEWALDEAHYWVMELTSDAWLTSDYGRDSRTRLKLIQPCSILAGRLWGAGLRERAREIYEVGTELLRVARKNRSASGLSLYDADKYIKNRLPFRFNLNHRRQADNAMRLGMIDEVQYKKIVDRVDGTQEQSAIQAKALKHYVSEVGFIQNLPPDKIAQGKTVSSKLVPYPEYFERRVEDLAHNQQAEYLLAFGGMSDLMLVRKYTYIRLTSLLETMILHWEMADYRAIEQESSSINGFQKTKHTGERSVATVARFLGKLTIQERRERCNSLRDLHNKAASEGVTMGRIINLAAILNLSSSVIAQEKAPSRTVDNAFRVELNDEYMDIVHLPIARLRAALRTGSIDAG